MRKKINGIITAICFLCFFIGAAGVDAENPTNAIILLGVAIVGIFIEGFYWRSVYGC